MVQGYLKTPERDSRFTVLALSDLRCMIEIELSGHAFPWSETIFRDCFKPGYLCWGIWSGDELVGFAILSWQFDELHLLNLCIRRAYHRSGLGRRLLRYVIANAHSEYARCLLLEVRVSNQAAIALYRKEGFVEIGRRKNYYPAGRAREDALVMALPCREALDLP